LNKLERRAALVAVLLAIVAAAIAGANLYFNGNASNQTTPNSFIIQPVLDIIIPSLFHESSTGGVNAPLNVSAGQSLSLSVQLFPITDLNVSMQFRYFALNENSTVSFSSSNINQSGQPLAATFTPSSVKLGAEHAVNLTMQLAISPDAMIGRYNTVISATNLQNSSQVWGVIVQINITK
jgi:hypothetical protein